MTTDDTVRGLVAKAREGDRAAFEGLVATYREGLVGRIRSRLGSDLGERVEVEDIVQETLIQMFQALPRFDWRGEASFRRWLWVIADHAVLKAARRNRRGPGLPLREDLPGESTSPSRLVRRHERLDRLRESVEGLSDDHREVIRLARIEGLPMEEIARRLGRTPEAAKQLLRRALGNLRKAFGDTESIHLPDLGLHDGEPGGAS